MTSPTAGSVKLRISDGDSRASRTPDDQLLQEHLAVASRPVECQLLFVHLIYGGIPIPSGEPAIAPSGFLVYSVKDVSQSTEERTGLLLFVLYVYLCVFWRGEAEPLA